MNILFDVKFHLDKIDNKVLIETLNEIDSSFVKQIVDCDVFLLELKKQIYNKLEKER